MVRREDQIGCLSANVLFNLYWKTRHWKQVKYTLERPFCLAIKTSKYLEPNEQKHLCGKNQDFVFNVLYSNQPIFGHRSFLDSNSKNFSIDRLWFGYFFIIKRCIASESPVHPALINSLFGCLEHSNCLCRIGISRWKMM